MRPKTFDCVEIMHKGADLDLAKTASMTREQEIDFWERAHRRLRESKRKVEETLPPDQDTTESP